MNCGGQAAARPLLVGQLGGTAGRESHVSTEVSMSWSVMGGAGDEPAVEDRAAAEQREVVGVDEAPGGLEQGVKGISAILGHRGQCLGAGGIAV